MQNLLHTTGCLEFADQANAHSVFANALASAEEHGLKHEILTSEEVRLRFPGVTMPANFKVIPSTCWGCLYDKGLTVHLGCKLHPELHAGIVPA